MLRSVAVVGAALFVAACGVGACGGRTPAVSVAQSQPAQVASRPSASAAKPSARSRTVVRKQTVTFVDHRRSVRRSGGTARQRRLVTIIRYPVGPRRRYPLVVFAHGFALTPRSYRKLLYAWASAGYVVAAPVFPGESADAPGGPDRSDLPNEPGDIRFIIDRMLAAARRGAGGFARSLSSGPVGIAGHSDGGDSALAVGYGPGDRSKRIGAVIILAGAYLPNNKRFRFPVGGPPLLAVQGDADVINPPSDTRAFYQRARKPKALLRFLGAGHYGPYTGQQPQAGVLQRATLAFLDHALKDKALSRRSFLRAGRRPGVSMFQIDGVGE